MKANLKPSFLKDEVWGVESTLLPPLAPLSLSPLSGENRRPLRTALTHN